MSPKLQHACNDLEVKIVKNWRPRTLLKLKPPKFAPRLRARTIWKSKSLKTEGARALLKLKPVAKICTTPARENDLEVKIVKAQGLGPLLEVQSAFRVAGAGILTGCKICGRRKSLWGLQKRWQAWWIWRGFEMMLFAWQAQGFRALWCRCLKPRVLNPWKGC